MNNQVQYHSRAMSDHVKKKSFIGQIISNAFDRVACGHLNEESNAEGCCSCSLGVKLQSSTKKRYKPNSQANVSNSLTRPNSQLSNVCLRVDVIRFFLLIVASCN